MNENYFSEFILLLEAVIVLYFIIKQLIVSKRIKKNIKILGKIFGEKLYVQKHEISEILESEESGDITGLFLEDEKLYQILEEANTDSVFILSTISKNPVISRIKTSINRYLLNNLKASTNFTNIKYIIENEVSIVDEEITNELSTPLYLGLAATELGIIFGLISVLLSLVGIDKELMFISVESGVTTNLLPLILGVAIAMSASFLGLFLTMRRSIKYTETNKLTSRAKNDVLSYLQAHLLPELIKAEDTGLQGLINNIDQFKIEAKDITSNILTSAMQSKENLQYQQDLLRKIEKIDINRISKANLEIFSKLEENLESIKSLGELLSSLGQISINLKEFANRTEDVELIIKQIENSQNDMSDVFQFMTKHFNEIEKLGRKSIGAISLADISFENALVELKAKIESNISTLNLQVSKADEVFSKSIEELTKNILAKIKSLEAITEKADLGLHDTFKTLSENLNKVTDEHINSLKKSYSDALPKFEKLNQLDILLEINKTLNDNRLQASLDNLTKKTDDHGTNLLNGVKTINSKINNRNLNSIEETLNAINTKLVGKKDYKPAKRSKPPIINKPDKTTLTEKLKKLIGSS